MKMSSCGKHWAVGNSTVGNRKNIILLGDIVDDVKMVDNIDYDNLLSIGFLNDYSEQHDNFDFHEPLEKYFEVYDLVIANDGNFTKINAIIKAILEPPKELPENIYGFDVSKNGK